MKPSHLVCLLLKGFDQEFDFISLALIYVKFLE